MSLFASIEASDDESMHDESLGLPSDWEESIDVNKTVIRLTQNEFKPKYPARAYLNIFTAKVTIRELRDVIEEEFENELNLYYYTDISTALQINDHQMTEFTISGYAVEERKVSIINYDLHVKGTNQILYGVIVPNDNYKIQQDKWLWKLDEFLTSDDILKKYCIKHDELPQSSRQMTRFQRQLSQTLVITESLIDNTDWFAVKQIKRLTRNVKVPKVAVTFTKEMWIKKCKESFQNVDLPLIPVVVNKNNNHWIEWIKIVYIKSQNITVGISCKYDRNAYKWMVESICLDRDDIYNKHRLVGHSNDKYTVQLKNFQTSITLTDIKFIDNESKDINENTNALKVQVRSQEYSVLIRQNGDISIQSHQLQISPQKEQSVIPSSKIHVFFRGYAREHFHDEYEDLIQLLIAAYLLINVRSLLKRPIVEQDFDNIDWRNVKVLKSKSTLNNSTGKSVTITQRDMTEYCALALQRAEYNDSIIPIVAADKHHNYYGIELVLTVYIIHRNCDVRVSFRFDDQSNVFKPSAIYLDKKLIETKPIFSGSKVGSCKRGKRFALRNLIFSNQDIYYSDDEGEQLEHSNDHIDEEQEEKEVKVNDDVPSDWKESIDINQKIYVDKADIQSKHILTGLNKESSEQKNQTYLSQTNALNHKLNATEHSGSNDTTLDELYEKEEVAVNNNNDDDDPQIQQLMSKIEELKRKNQAYLSEIKAFKESRTVWVELCESAVQHIHVPSSTEEKQENHSTEQSLSNDTTLEELEEIVDAWDVNGNNIDSDYKQCINQHFQSTSIVININSLKDGNTIKLRVDPNDTIKNLKKRIKLKLRVEEEMQRLIFKNNEQLKNEHTLKYYNISNNATIGLVLKLRGGCFTGNTKVLTRNKSTLELEGIEIENISKGDAVLTCNLDTNIKELHSVKSVLKYEVNEVVQITFDNGSTITCTASHPFYVPQKQNWCCIQPMAKDTEYGTLCLNDYVINYKSEKVRVTDIEYKYINNGDTITVYTLHLTEIHNFYANGILVHNSMQIFVKTKAGKVYTLDVEPTDTIKAVKIKLSKESNISVEEQRLVINKEQLHDAKTLKDYKIKKESTLYLVSNFDQLESLIINPSRKLTKNIERKEDFIAEKFNDVSGYMNKYILFHGNHAFIKCNNHMNLVIDYNFHSLENCEETKEETVGDSLYVICDKAIKRKKPGFEWKIRDELFTAKQVEDLFKISKTTLPTPMQKVEPFFMDQLKQNMNEIRCILEKDEQRNKQLINNKRIPWSRRDKIPIFGKRSKSPLSLRLRADDFVKQVGKSADDNDVNLVPIVTMDQCERFAIEIVWIVKIEHNVVIGISLKLTKQHENNKIYESLKVLGIYLDLNDQHKLIPYEHNCQCLTDFDVCSIDQLEIGNEVNQIRQKHKALQKKFNDVAEKIKILENVKRNDLCLSEMTHFDIASVPNPMINQLQMEEAKEEHEEEKEDILEMDESTPTGPDDMNETSIPSSLYLDADQLSDCHCLAAQKYKELQQYVKLLENKNAIDLIRNNFNSLLEQRELELKQTKAFLQELMKQQKELQRQQDDNQRMINSLQISLNPNIILQQNIINN